MLEFHCEKCNKMFTPDDDHVDDVSDKDHMLFITAKHSECGETRVYYFDMSAMLGVSDDDNR